VIDLMVMFLALGALAWLAAVALASLLSRQSLNDLTPGNRIRETTLVALLPWVLPVTWTASLGVVAAGKRLGWLNDHCGIHGDAHPHFCLSHFPALQIDPWAVAAMSLVLVALTVIALRHVLAVLENRNRLSALLRLLPRGGLLRRIEDARPVALVARPLRPVVLISRGLLDRLDRRERRVVLAHEGAHLRGNDLLKSSLLEALLAIHLPATAARLRTAWRQAIEERADDRVAQRFGRETTARTLLKVVRLQRFPVTDGLAASGANVAHRVERLLDGEDRSGTLARSGAGFIAALALASALPLAGAHHAIETLLGAILGG